MTERPTILVNSTTFGRLKNEAGDIFTFGATAAPNPGNPWVVEVDQWLLDALNAEKRDGETMSETVTRFIDNRNRR